MKLQIRETLAMLFTVMPIAESVVDAALEKVLSSTSKIDRTGK